MGKKVQKYKNGQKLMRLSDYEKASLFSLVSDATSGNIEIPKFLDLAQILIKSVGWDMGDENPTLRIENNALKSMKINNDTCAFYDSVNNEIVFNEAYLKNLTTSENCLGSFCNTLLHEWEHFLQHKLFEQINIGVSDELKRVADFLEIDYTMPEWREFDIEYSFNIYRKYNNIFEAKDLNELKHLFVANYKFAMLSDTNSSKNKLKQIEDTNSAVEDYVSELLNGENKNKHPFIIKIFKNFISGQLGSDWMIKDDKLIKELQFARYLKKHSEQDARVKASNKHLEFVFALIEDDCVPEGISNFALYHELPFVISEKKAEIKRRENKYLLYDFFIQELERTIKTKKLSYNDLYFIQNMVEVGRDKTSESKKNSEANN